MIIGAMDELLTETIIYFVHSPDDEIEREIVYLQPRLLDGVISMKQRYGKFLFFMYIIIPYAAIQDAFGCCPLH
jgi:hypothetical protein